MYDLRTSLKGSYVEFTADSQMQFFLRMLADVRWIPLSQINHFIRYLTERQNEMSSAPSDDMMLG